MPEIALLGPEYSLIVNVDGTNARLFSSRSSSPMQDRGDRLPEKRDQMSELALGIHSTSKYLMSNNMQSHHRVMTGG